MARPALMAETLNRLQEKSEDIVGHENPPARADIVYSSSRVTRWFAPVIDALKQMAGIGERCMFCSGSESSNVEHFRPKAVFPEDAMRWENLLWSCGVCNCNKGNAFPLIEKQLINPIDENVWDFLFIDEYGNLTPLWRPDLDNVDPRGISTIETLGLDRDALQQTRQCRMRNLRHLISGAIRDFDRGEISAHQLGALVREWISEPYQPDVADFFFRGPGVDQPPFSEILAKVGYLNEQPADTDRSPATVA